MKPQSVVAILLALLLFMVIGGKVAMVFVSGTPVTDIEAEKLWLGFMGLVAGGLLAYIGGSGDK